MSRIKRLGAAYLATFVVTAAFASAAIAAEFNSESPPTQLSGSNSLMPEGEQVFTTNGGTFKCKEAKFTGVMATSPAKEIAIHPTYGGCTFFGMNVSFDTTGCNYVLSAASLTAGSLSIACEKGKEISYTIASAGCTVKIKSQIPFNNALALSNSGGGSTRSLVVKEQIGSFPVEKGKATGIAYTSSGGWCGEGGQNLAIRGGFTLKGYSDAALTKQVGIWIA